MIFSGIKNEYFCLWRRVSDHLLMGTYLIYTLNRPCSQQSNLNWVTNFVLQIYDTKSNLQEFIYTFKILRKYKVLWLTKFLTARWSEYYNSIGFSEIYFKLPSNPFIIMLKNPVSLFQRYFLPLCMRYYALKLRSISNSYIHFLTTISNNKVLNNRCL